MLEGLAGKRLLILLDERPLEAATRRVLEGARVDLVVAGGDRGKALLEEGRFDAVIIDINVDAGVAISLVERLEELRLPFLFALIETGPLSGRRYSGYRLCSDTEELAIIGEALSMPALP